jgi:endoglucanase
MVAPTAVLDMHDEARAFLDDLIGAASPSGFETAGQRVWVEYVEQFADEVHTDAYGNAVAVYDGGGGPKLAFAGHMDEIGFAVAAIDEDGFLRLSEIGGIDKTVSKGQHVDVHTATGVVPGVIGQTAMHHRENRLDEDPQEIHRQHVDVGAADEAEARELVEVGDPITVAVETRDLAGTRVAARAMDNRAGTWVAAETLRRAAERDVDSTVCAVSTVQEEVGFRGAQMVGYDVHPDAAIAIDVTHASDHPQWPEPMHAEVEVGGGPVISRGTANHPALVNDVRAAAAAEDLPFQLQATSTHTGTDADGFYTERGGIPSLYLGIPNRYMHTPAEVVDLADLDVAADILAAVAEREAGREDFSVDV